MQSDCPPAIDLHMDVPHEHIEGEILRSNEICRFHVEAGFDLDELRAFYGLSHDAMLVTSTGESYFALQIKLCEVNGNFCTPFAEAHDPDHEDHDDEAHDSHDDDHGDNDSQEGDDHSSHGHGNEQDEGDHHGHGHRRARTRSRTLAGHTIESTEIIFAKDLGEYFHGPGNDHDGHDHGHDHGESEKENDCEDDDHGHGHSCEEESEDDGHDHNGHDSDEQADIAVLESPIILIPIESGQTEIHVSLDIPVNINLPGVFLPLATMQLFLSNATIHGHEPGTDEIAAVKIDVANALHQRTLIYQEPAEILEISNAAAYISYVIIGIVGIGETWFLSLIIKYRKEKIMILSQGFFLVFFQLAGIVAVISCILFQPVNDVFCNLSGPLVLLPLQFMLAILFGRLRRIITVMSPIMSVGDSGETNSTRRSTSSDTGKQPTLHWRMSQKVRKQRKLRQEFTAWRSWRVISIITMPQIVLQIVHKVMFPPHLTLILNADGSIGRYQCGNDESLWFQFGELLCVYVTLLALLIESQRSKSLPALFNEASFIAQASMGTVFIATAGLMIVAFSREPTSNPDVRYVMLVFVVLAFVVNLSVRLVLPKLQLIWSGEKVVVSRILREHRQSLAKANSSVNMSSRTNQLASAAFMPKKSNDAFHNVSKLTGESEKSIVLPIHPLSEEEEEAKTKTPSPVSPVKSVSWTGKISQAVGGGGHGGSTSPIPGLGLPLVSENLDAHEKGDQHIHSFSGIPEPPLVDVVNPMRSSKNESQSSESTDMLIAEGHAPPSKVMLAINEQAALLARVNDRILSGLEVPKKDWEELRASFGEMHDFFGQVRYQWNKEDMA